MESEYFKNVRRNIKCFWEIRVGRRKYEKISDLIDGVMLSVDRL